MRITILLASLIFCVSGFCGEPDFSKPVGLVNDFAGILTESQLKQVTEIAENLKRDTTAEIAIVTVKTIKPYTLEEYSVRLFEKWGIGRRGKDNGVLLLVTMEERKIKIEVGYGLEGVLPDGLCGEIIRNYIIPEFKKGDFGQGVLDGAKEIASIVSGKGYNKTSSGDVQDFTKEVHSKVQRYSRKYKVLIIVIAIFLSMLFPNRRRRYYGGGGGYGNSSGFGGFGGGGFGGFGGGRSGGGGASGGW
jgi:uncharacterized protein